MCALAPLGFVLTLINLTEANSSLTSTEQFLKPTSSLTLDFGEAESWGFLLLYGAITYYFSVASLEIRCLKPLVWMDLATTTYDETRGSRQNSREPIGWKSWSVLCPKLRGHSLSHTERLKNMSTLQQWSNSSERLLSSYWSVCVCVCVLLWVICCLHMFAPFDVGKVTLWYRAYMAHRCAQYLLSSYVV